ncbi:MAG TPA: hypothetical protein VI653_23140 [Steroidobacteraceae bacterium]
MANAGFTTFYDGIMTGAIDLDTASIKASLVRGYTFVATHTFVSDITGAGGTLNGTTAALSSVTVSGGVFNAANTTLSSTASGTNHGILVYQSSAVTGGADVAASAQRVICYLDTGTGLPIQPGTGTVAINWDTGTNKILKIG